MATSPLFPLLLITFLPLLAQSKLTLDYYKKTCPKFASIVEETVFDKQRDVPTTAAGTLRLFFHDCVVGGCDASILLSSNPMSGLAERDQDINKALPGDAYDLIIRIKNKVELACPGIVSCADILAEATRDLVSMVGGPFYPVNLGRKDSFGSRASDVEGHIARPNMTVSTIIDIFSAKSFTIREMVALTGAHTIGFAHCSEFANRVYTNPPDKTMNMDYVKKLKVLCNGYQKNPAIAAFFDPISPGKIDNNYYVNLQHGVSLLKSDQALALDPRTKPFVDLYATNQAAWFADFAHAMEKTSALSVKTGRKGEVRRTCNVPNSTKRT